MNIQQILKTPWIDKVIAVVAVSPFVYSILRLCRSSNPHFQFGFVFYFVQCGILVFSMVLRRAPLRVSVRPSYWILTFVASYWSFIGEFFNVGGRQVAPSWLTDFLAIISLLVFIWSRLSLGRSMGLVPAQREIVVTGIYRYVRHPIYLAIFIDLFGTCLQMFSVVSCIYFSLGILWYLIKSLAEEDFLKSDPKYLRYMSEVRCRWIPGLV